MHSTLPPTVPPGIVNSMLSATVGSWKTMHRFAVDYWLGALQRGATPLELVGDLHSWSAEVSERRRPVSAHEYSIIKEWPLARLRDYSTPDADPSMLATVILPPQAGHDSSIVDFARGQSQVRTARESGCHRIYSLDWVDATQETKDLGIDDYMALLRETTDLLGGKVNLVGDCQGGWLATIFAALHPERVNSLAIAGAPIDFHAGEPLIHDWVKVLAPGGDMSFFRSAVDQNDGLLPGRFLLDGFKMLEPDRELERKLQLLTNLNDSDQVERYRKFEDWFQWTQTLPGEFYLWIVEHLFVRNSLIKGELVVEGQTVDLKAIDCPVFLMAGQTDHITPADQVWALSDYISTPAGRIGHQLTSKGHLGLFMGRDALQSHWPVIFKAMADLSSAPAEEKPEVSTDEATSSAAATSGAAATEAPASKAPASKAPARKAPASKKATASKSTAASKTSARSQSAAKAPAAKTAAPKTSAAKTPAKSAPQKKAAGSTRSTKSASNTTRQAPAPTESSQGQDASDDN